MYYIPLNNPTVTRLATIAANIIRNERCGVIFSYYFEPYGLAAHLASYWTAIPYVLKHAGSDLNRLMALDELQTCYLEVLLAQTGSFLTDALAKNCSAMESLKSESIRMWRSAFP